MQTSELTITVVFHSPHQSQEMEPGTSQMLLLFSLAYFNAEQSAAPVV